MKLRNANYLTLKQRNYLGLCRRAQCNNKGPKKSTKEAKSQRIQDEDVTAEGRSEWWDVRRTQLHLLALKMEVRPTVKGHWQPLEAGDGKEGD